MIYPSYVMNSTARLVYPQQRGFALVVCLIVLFAMTTLVFSSLAKVSTLERRTASTATKNSAKQAASSAVSWYVNTVLASNTDLMEQALNSDEKISAQVAAVLPEEDYTGTVRVKSLGFVPDTTSSLNADESAASLQIPRFEVIAEGYLSSDERVKVVVGQGVDY